MRCIVIKISFINSFVAPKQATSMSDNHYDFSKPPLNLLRARKTDKTDLLTNVMTIQLDLRCCGRNYPSTSAVNTHYLRKHSNTLPHSDPATWSHVIIKDPIAHAALALHLPFVPFPAQQPRESTWTIRVSARTAGTTEERALKRRRPNKSIGSLSQQCDALQGLEKEVAEAKSSLLASQEQIHQLEDTNFQQSRIIKELNAMQGPEGTYAELHKKYVQEKKAGQIKWEKLIDAARQIHACKVERDAALASKAEYKKGYTRKKKAEMDHQKEKEVLQRKLDLNITTNQALMGRLCILEAEKTGLVQRLARISDNTPVL